MPLNVLFAPVWILARLQEELLKCTKLSLRDNIFSLKQLPFFIKQMSNDVCFVE